MSDATTALAAAQAAAAASQTASDAADFAVEKAVEVNADRVAAQTAKNDAQAAAAAAGAQMWVGGEAVTTATVRQAPDGSRIKSTAARTTRATFDATEQGFWTPVLSTAGTLEQAALTATIAAQALPKPTRVEDINYPAFIAHRGAQLIYPQHSMEGYRAAFQSGFLPEIDVRQLADGTLVCIHDATVDTATDGTGNVIDKTLSQWRALKLKPKVTGGDQARTVEFEQVLNELGGRVVMLIEAKTEGALIPMLDAVVARGLERSVILNGSSYLHCTYAVSRGVTAMYLSDSATPATLVADGVEWVGVTTSATSGYVASCTAAGLKVCVYTVNDPTAVATWTGYGCTAFICDDPWGGAGSYIKTDADPFAKKLKWHGAAAIGSTEKFARLDEYGLGTEGGAGATGAQVFRSFGKRGASVRIRWRVRYAPTSNATMTQWGGSIYLGRTPANQPFLEGGGMDQDGYHCFIRRNGDLNLYRVDDSLPTSLGSNTVDPDVAANTAEGFADVELTITATGITFKNLTTGSTVTSADTTYRLAGVWEISSRWSSTHAYLSRLVVEDLP